jgi:3'(2'), 5'-bisphosphate nucleotidase
MKQDYCDYLDEVRAIAAEAGRRILEIYERDFNVSEKDDGSPLTEADAAAHEVIAARLAQLAPGVPVLSEESSKVDYAERAAWRRFWLVDPLDGTKEFVKRNGEFTVNIALVEGGRAVLGVVHVPVKGVTYSACAGRGAFKQEGGGAAQPIRVRTFAGGNAIVVASRSHAGRHIEGFLKNVGAHDVVSMGSALKLCLVADGTADVYPRLGPTMEWDTAAAQCVVEAAGGRVTDLRGQPLQYNKVSLLNPWFMVTGAGGRDWHRALPPEAVQESAAARA